MLKTLTIWDNNLPNRLPLTSLYQRIQRDAVLLMDEYETLFALCKSEEETEAYEEHRKVYLESVAILHKPNSAERVYHNMVPLAFANVVRARQIKYGLFGPYGRIAPRCIPNQLEECAADLLDIQGLELIKVFSKLKWIRLKLNYATASNYQREVLQGLEKAARRMTTTYKTIHRTNDINPQGSINKNHLMNEVRLMTIKAHELEREVKSDNRKLVY